MEKAGGPRRLDPPYSLAGFLPAPGQRSEGRFNLSREAFVTTEPSAASQREDQLDEIVLAYLKAVDAGETPDHQAILARHPDFATELAAFFDDQENINRFSMPVFGLTKEPS